MDDIILVLWGNKLHEAKVLRVGDGEHERQVYVHYHRWASHWDDWVQLQYTRPITAESRAEQARMKAEFDRRHSRSEQRRPDRDEADAGMTAAARTQSLTADCSCTDTHLLCVID